MWRCVKVRRSKRRTTVSLRLDFSFERRRSLLHFGRQCGRHLVGHARRSCHSGLFDTRTANVSQFDLFRADRSVRNRKRIRTAALQHQSLQQMRLLGRLLTIHLFSLQQRRKTTRVSSYSSRRFRFFFDFDLLDTTFGSAKSRKTFSVRKNNVPFVPAPNGKQRSLSFEGKSGLNVTSFGAQSFDGSMS